MIERGHQTLVGRGGHLGLPVRSALLRALPC
jgi:hypothetical protein